MVLLLVFKQFKRTNNGKYFTWGLVGRIPLHPLFLRRDFFIMWVYQMYGNGIYRVQVPPNRAKKQYGLKPILNFECANGRFRSWDDAWNYLSIDDLGAYNDITFGGFDRWKISL